MLLQRLVEYQERPADGRAAPLPGYGPVAIRYIVDIDSKGHLVSPAPIDTADPAGRQTKRGTRRLAPTHQRASAVRPLLLADNAEYTFGLARTTVERAKVRHAAYLGLLERCATETGDPAVAAVLSFARSDPLAELILPSDFDAGAFLTFSVDGSLPIERAAVAAFWAAEHDPAAHGADVMQCVVCGRERAVLDRLPKKVKGVPGGQTSGTSLISANALAFESYGLHESRIAPTCRECAEGFTDGLNELLATERTSIRVGDVAFIFWTKGRTSFAFRRPLETPDPEEVRALIAAAWSPVKPELVDDTRFFAAALSASGGRVVVRDWLDATLVEAKASLGRWFAQQAIVSPNGETWKPHGLFALASSTVRDIRDLPRPLPRALLHSALTGAALPPDILAAALRRVRAAQDRTPQDAKFTHPRAALIKLCLARQLDWRDHAMESLESGEPRPAYHCGRLLAVLEEAQREAIPNLSATLVDRFYGSASSAPASVFGTLLHGARPHLAKLERDRPGVYHAIERRLEEVLAAISPAGFPTTLTLQEQGLFALGYYHQRAKDRAEMHRRADARRKGSEEPSAEASVEPGA